MKTDTSPATGLNLKDLAQQAAEWRLMALLLERPIGDWATQVAALAAEVGDEGLRAAAQAAQAQASQSLYDSTFGPGGPAAPREVSYRQCLEAGSSLAELEAFYEIFAFRHDTPEPADHVAVQTNFISYLLLKQLYARVAGDDQQSELVARAIQHIVQDHLSNIAEPLAGALQSSGIDYLALALAALLQRVGPRRSLRGLGVPGTSVASNDDPLTCPGEPNDCAGGSLISITASGGAGRSQPA
jgi:TorA maturation chaperone TorD